MMNFSFVRHKQLLAAIHEASQGLHMGCMSLICPSEYADCLLGACSFLVGDSSSDFTLRRSSRQHGKYIHASGALRGNKSTVIAISLTRRSVACRIGRV